MAAAPVVGGAVAGAPGVGASDVGASAAGVGSGVAATAVAGAATGPAVTGAPAEAAASGGAAAGEVGVAGGAPLAGDAPLAGGDGATLATARAENCTYPYSRTDATGTEVTIAEEPRTVVTLGPSAAQTMWEVGGREKVVGVTQFATYLENASTRANVSGPGRTPVSIEAVVGLQPDLVLAPNVIRNDTVAALRRAGLTVYRFRAAGSIADVAAKTRLTGRLTGECEGAAETVAWMEERLSTVRQAVAGEPRPRVLYAFFGFTAGNGTFVHEVITTAGGRNVAAEAGLSGFVRLNEEVVVSGDPEWILLNSDGPRVPRSAAFNSTTAVREDQTVVVDANYVSQPAPRIVYPVQTLAAALHPKAYAAANATKTPTAAGTTTVTPSATAGQSSDGPRSDGSPTPGSGNPAGPGAIPAAGPAAALAAVLAGAVLATRRR